MTYRVICHGTSFKTTRCASLACASLASACLLAAETAAARQCRAEFAILPAGKVAAADEICRIWWSADLQAVRSMIPGEPSIVDKIGRTVSLIIVGVVVAVNREVQMERRKQCFGAAEI